MRTILKITSSVVGPTANHSFSYCVRHSVRFFSRWSSANDSALTSTIGTKKSSKIRVKWFYATDVPLSKPEWFNYQQEKDAANFIPFSDYDSGQLESKYQELHRQVPASSVDISPTVEVNEDKLFQVDLKKFEIEPIYWEGPIYEVRRGTWFDSGGIPLPYKVARAIEDGYQHLKPYQFVERPVLDDMFSKENVARFSSQRDLVVEFNKLKDSVKEVASSVKLDEEPDLIELSNGNYVLFVDSKDAFIFPKSFNTPFQLNAIRTLAPTSAAYMVGVQKIQRGYTDDLGESILDSIANSNPLPNWTETIDSELGSMFRQKTKKSGQDSSTQENQHMKKVMESDYDLEVSAASSNREIDHLVLCVHGIGQVLGGKYESVNFTHSINVLRKTMRTVYKEDKRYKALAYPKDESVETTKNNRIQVLPISWRHKVDFHPSKPIESFDSKGKHRLPTLSQINVDGVKALRSLLGDVVLDILLYYEPKYANQIYSVVISELNRVYQLYKERNPHFNGKIHIMGHSLGSAIVFDIMSNQRTVQGQGLDLIKELDFEVENLFCVGSPAGMFKLLEQKNIASRSLVSGPISTEYDSPKCKSLFNIFHPCDPVGYRMEPLVNPEYARFKPEQIPFAVRGLNTQIKELASMGDGLSEKILKASNWFSKGGDETKTDGKSVEEVAAQETPLGDIITSIAKGGKKSDSKSVSKKVELQGDKLEPLLALNRTGRVDYCLPMGVFDLSFISAVSAHVSYFEDEDTAGFIMKEVLSSGKEAVTSKTFTTYQ
ncbi:predicted protein [Scheffersomyces stipitis CBS 6054]|uniref:DDHD domain-containing protein n=1 Tax=Scheffersomyces stipitis (strain ATCC 58785 / CBS 6054 / NBRC 10063 / NRRL Y-11545) TaxID=322104 RepID=A3LNA7_PICST|nr:predicted protein [Scheffersomyces stipitis CBS 6054]ABN64301.2 predicted protein [Scheffersomyces stipitis CBS 6054]